MAAIAIVVLGRWTPLGVAGGALLFGAASALQFAFQAMGWNAPYQLFLVAPYILTLIILAAPVLNTGDLVIRRGESALGRYLRGLLKVFKGTHLEGDETTLARGARIEVSSDRPFTVYADGDPIATTPVTMSVEKQALRVVVPA